MQKKDLKTGVLYGYVTGTSEYRTASPLIVLDTSQLWSYIWNLGSSQRKFHVSGVERPRKNTGWSRHGDDGYLALSGSEFGDAEDKAATLAAMAKLAEWFATTAGDADAVEALRQRLDAEDVVGAVSLEIVNNRWIEGEYANAKNEEQARSDARNAHWDAEREAARKEQVLIASLQTALEARGIVGHEVYKDCGNFRTGRVSVGADVLAHLLGVETEESS